jgi:DNA-binding SARP family transcriptional activator
VGALGEAGSDAAVRNRLLESLGVPYEPRGIVLLCGYFAAAVFGVFAILTPPGDPIGWAYIALAIIGYWFIPTRGLTTFLWLLVAVGGAAVAYAGAASGWLECALGVALALVGLSPTRRHNTGAVAAETTLVEPPLPNGESPSLVQGSSDPSPSEPASEALGGASTQLFIRAIGPLHLVVDGRDVTAGLERKRVLAFLFKYMLARLVLEEPETKRDDIAEELSPRVPEANRLGRLRKQIYKLQKTTPPEVGALVRANQTHVWLDLDSTDSDFRQLTELCARIGQRGPLIDSALANLVRKMLSRTEGDFLAGFEVLEQRVNDGDGTAGQTVGAARELIWKRRTELIVALAEYEDAMGRPDTAIAPLAAALDALPERQDLARMLATAYLKTGQTVRAAEVRRQYGLKQE